MIYNRDKAILAEIINAYKAKNSLDKAPVDIDEISFRWGGRDFEKNLIAVMSDCFSERDNSFTERNIDIIFRYHEGKTFMSLGDKHGITKSRTSQVYWKSIYKLADLDIIGQICKGLNKTHEEKERILSEKEIALNKKMEQLAGQTLYMYESSLMVRERNLLLRSGVPSVVGLDELQYFEATTDITKFSNCGVKSAHNIIDYFKSLNIDTEHWEDCIMKAKLKCIER